MFVCSRPDIRHQDIKVLDLREKRNEKQRVPEGLLKQIDNTINSTLKRSKSTYAYIVLNTKIESGLSEEFS